MQNAIHSLSLFHFRNYEELNLSFIPAPVVLTGPNGSGKTNILEAISLFSPGRGLRGAKLSEISNASLKSSSLLWATSLILNNEVQLSTGLEVSLAHQSGEKRIHKIQHESVRGQNSFAEWLNIIWLTPETDRIFLESPSTRRKFIDRLVFAEDPLHSERLNRYEYALRERLQILRQGGDPLWLNSLEEQLSSLGVAIAIARKNLMQRLSEGQEYQHALFPRFKSQMIGEIDEWVLEGYAVDIEAKVMEAFQKNRASDRESGTTRIGPHRSDWQVIHNTKGMIASNCSTGEQKILLIATIFSFIQQKVRTDDRLIVLLLDDVIAHLDFHHRVVLFDQICALQNNHQKECKGSVNTWLTGTDPLLFETLIGQGQFFSVDNAILTPG